MIKPFNNVEKIQFKTVEFSTDCIYPDFFTENCFLRALINTLVSLKSPGYHAGHHSSAGILNYELLQSYKDCVYSYTDNIFSKEEMSPIEKEIIKQLIITRENVDKYTYDPPINATAEPFIKYIASTYPEFFKYFGTYISHLFFFMWKGKKVTLPLNNNFGMAYPIVSYRDDVIVLSFVFVKSHGTFQTSGSLSPLNTSAYLGSFEFDRYREKTIPEFIQVISQFVMVVGSINGLYPGVISNRTELNLFELFKYTDSTSCGFGFSLILSSPRVIVVPYRDVLIKVVESIYPEDFDPRGYRRFVNSLMTRISASADPHLRSMTVAYPRSVANVVDVFYDMIHQILGTDKANDSGPIEFCDSVISVFAILSMYIMKNVSSATPGLFNSRINYSNEASDDDQDVKTEEDVPSSSSQDNSTENEFGGDDAADDSASDFGSDDSFGDDSFGDDGFGDDSGSGGGTEMKVDDNIEAVKDDFFTSTDEMVSISSILYKVELYKQLKSLSQDTRLSRVHRLVLFNFATKYVFRVDVKLTERLLADANKIIT